MEEIFSSEVLVLPIMQQQYSKQIDLDGYGFILLLSCTFAETNLASSSFFVKLKSSSCAYSIGADYHLLFYFLWIHSPLIATFDVGAFLCLFDDSVRRNCVSFLRE
jgi:hypothetical protein